MRASGFLWSEPAVRLDPAEAAERAREFARACFAVPEGRARGEFLKSGIAPQVAWSADGSRGARSDLSVGQMLTAAQRLESMIANAPDRGGLGSSEELLATVFEFLMTATGDNPVLAALDAVAEANKPMRSAARPRIGARRRVARALASSAPAVRVAHARLRQATAADPVLGREP